MVLAEDIIFAVRDLLNNDKGNLNFSPSAHYAVQKLIDYAEQEHEQREKRKPYSVTSGARRWRFPPRWRGRNARSTT